MNKKISYAILGSFATLLLVVIVAPSGPMAGVRDFLAAAAGQRPGVFAMTSLTVTCVGDMPLVSAAWSQSNNAEAYDLERKYPWANGWEVTGETTELALNDATWRAGYGVGLYSYRVRALSALSSRLSAAQTIDIGACVATPAPTPSATTTPPVATTTTPVTPEPAPAPSPVSPVVPAPAPSPAPAPTPTPTAATGTVATTTTSTTPPAPAPAPIPAPAPAPVSTGASVVPANLIQNPSFETDANGDNFPDLWSKGGWGTSNRAFTYPVPGVDGNRAASISVSGYVSGDAKWVSGKVPVTAGKSYRFSDQYLSTGSSQVLLSYTNTSGVVSYALLASLPSSLGVWKSYTATFTAPSGAASLSVYHLINSNGVLTLDGLSLVDLSSVTTTPAPQPAPAPVPAPVPSPTPTPSPTPSPAPATVTGKIPSWVKWGAYVGWEDNAMSNFEALVGKQPSMEMVFAHWGNDQFPTWYAPRIKDKGRTMVLFWEALDYNRDYFSQPEYSFDSVLAGKQDAYISKFAADAKAYGGEVIIIPYSEFNGDWFPWGGTIGNNTPAKYKAAYQYLRKFFVTAPNVKFGWAVNADSVPDTAANQPELFYPGDAYVDIVGVDGFNSGKPTWMTFDQVFNDPITRLKVYNKPIYIFSVGSQEDARKPAWITDGLATQLAKYPEVKAVLWFNQNKEYNWLVNSSAASLTAFKSVLP
jgi:outer membrane biosynthesis protein TonB